MSKGPGKLQRRILQAIDAQEWVYLGELLPAGYTHSDYSALMRAAAKLRRAGLIVMRFHKGAKVKKFQPGDKPQTW